MAQKSQNVPTQTVDKSKPDETPLPWGVRKSTRVTYPKGTRKETTLYHPVVSHRGFMLSGVKSRDLQTAVLRRDWLLQLLNLPVPEDFEYSKGGLGEALGINIPLPKYDHAPTDFIDQVTNENAIYANHYFWSTDCRVLTKPEDYQATKKLADQAFTSTQNHPSVTHCGNPPKGVSKSKS